MFVYIFRCSINYIIKFKKRKCELSILENRTHGISYLPTTCNSVCAVRVEKDGASAVTSHEKLPDSPNPTLRITT